MQYVQSLPPVYTPTSPTGTVVEAQAAPAVQRVEPHRTPEVPLQRLDTRLPALEQRWDARKIASTEQDRRKVCRRLFQEPVLEELRSGIDRRRHNQRKTDITTAVDEKI